MTKKLPPITPKQQHILSLIYKYRFLNRTQIQTLLKHKDKRRILSWLKDLREKDYLAWQYDSSDFINKTKPAIYYLSLNGIRYLKSTEIYSETELRKRYKDSARQQTYIDQSILIADCCNTLEASNNDEINYTYIVEADYMDPNSQFHYLNDLKPALYFIKNTQSNDETSATEYLLDIFNLTSPRYAVKRKLDNYLEYLDDATGDQVVLLAFDSVAELLYAKRRVKLLLEDTDEDKQSNIRFTTTDKIKQYGVSAEIWESIY